MLFQAALPVGLLVAPVEEEVVALPASAAVGGVCLRGVGAVSTFSVVPSITTPKSSYVGKAFPGLGIGLSSVALCRESLFPLVGCFRLLLVGGLRIVSDFTRMRWMRYR